MSTKQTDDNKAHAKHAATHTAKIEADKAKPVHSGNHIEGEHITQRKPDLSEAFAHTGANATIEDVGTGTIVEDAPAVRSTISDTDRVVQQGDEVIVHGRAIIDGLTEAHGLVLKVNQSGSIAVRIQRSNGQTFDVPGEVHNADLGDGSTYWTWPEKPELDVDRKAVAA
jgi:hypothetical protein